MCRSSSRPPTTSTRSSVRRELVDYLLKPIEAERLDRALDKLARLADSHGPTSARLPGTCATQLGQVPRRRARPERLPRASVSARRSSKWAHHPLLLEGQADLCRRRRPRSRDRLHARGSGGAPRSAALRQDPPRDDCEPGVRGRALSGVDGMLIRLKDDGKPSSAWPVIACATSRIGSAFSPTSALPPVWPPFNPFPCPLAGKKLG
jgi:hypothetical protein